VPDEPYSGMDKSKSKRESLFLQKIESKESKKKGYIKNRLIKGSLAIDRQLTYFIWARGTKDRKIIQLSKRLDFKFFRVAAVIAKKILMEDNFSGQGFLNIEEAKIISEYRRLIGSDIGEPRITFTDKDYRDILNMKNLSSKNIRKEVEHFGSFLIWIKDDIPTHLLTDKDGSEIWQTYKAENALFFEVKIEEHERKKRGRGAGKKECIYEIRFASEPALTFIHNILSFGVSLIDTDFFKKNQNMVELFLAISWLGKGVVLSEFQIAQILGWKISKRKEIRYQNREKIISLLKVMAENKWIICELVGENPWKWYIKPVMRPLLGGK